MPDVDVGFFDEADPDRESLTDKIGAGKYGEAAGQALQMVTPSSFWQQPTLDSVLQDFVEFSPYGDVKDLVSALRPGSNLDPLERTLAGFSALPMMAFTATSGHFALKKLELIQQSGAAVAATAAPIGGMDITTTATPVTGGIDGSVEASMVSGEGRLQFPGEAKADDLVDASGQQVTRDTDTASKIAAEIWMSTNPHAVIATTQSFDQLTAVVVDRYGEALRPSKVAPNDVSADTMYDPAFHFDAAMRQVGQRLVLAHEDVIPMEDTKGNQFSTETREVAAAQYAITATLTAAQNGLLDEQLMPGLEAMEEFVQDTRPMTIDRIMGNLFDARSVAKEADIVYQIAKGLLGSQIGPDLITNPQTSIQSILVTPIDKAVQQGKGAIVVTGVQTELMPMVRVVDRGTGFVLDKAALDDRHMRVNYETLTGDFAANLLTTLTQERATNPERFEKNLRWYHNAHATTMMLSDLTGKSPETIAALFSALSPRSKWTPDNIVAGIHVALRYTLPDLDPRSDAYRQVFVDLIDAGAWREDLFNESSKPTQKVIGSQDQVAEYYSNMENFLTEKKTGLRGFTLDKHQESALQLLLLDVEWPVVMRMMKTSNFQQAILNPFDMFLVAVDTHQSAGMLGGVIFGEALVHKGQVEMGSKKGDVISGAAYEGVSGTLTPDMLNDLRQTIIETLAKRNKDGTLKVTAAVEARADAAVRRARKVPNAEQQSRYRPAALAHAIVAQLAEIDTTSAAQAVVWFPFRLMKDSFRFGKIGLNQAGSQALAKEIDGYVQEIIEKGYIDLNDGEKFKRIEALKQVWDRAMWDWSVADHLEGTPTMGAGAAKSVTNASSSPASVVPDGYFEAARFRSTGEVKWKSGTAILSVKLYDGQVEVWADETIPGVRELLKNLYPSDLKNGQYTRYFPRHAKTTTVVGEQMKRLVAQTDQYGRPVSAEVRESTTPVAQHVALRNGNHLVAEVGSRHEADQLIHALQGEHPTSIEVVQSSLTYHGVGVNTLSRSDLSTLHEESDSTFEDQDWVAISAENPHGTAQSPALNAVATEKLRKQLIRQVMKLSGITWAEAAPQVILQDGIYFGEAETSFLVFGLPYDKAIQLGVQHGQESVATRGGLFFVTGEDAGTYIPSSGPVKTGPKGTFVDDAGKPSNRSTVVIDGRTIEWTAQYDSDMMTTPESPNELLNRPSVTEGVFQVIVELGGVDNNLTSDISDRLVNTAKKQNPQSMALYLHGDVWRQPGWTHAYEHVYTDKANNTSSFRTTQDTGTNSSNQFDVYLLEGEALRLSDKNADLTTARRTGEQARALTTYKDGGFADVAGEVEISFPVTEANIRVPKGQVFQGFIGKTEMHTTIYLNEDGSVVMVKTPWRLATETEAQKGVVYVSGSKRSGYAAKTYDRADAVHARDALHAVGVESEPRFYGGPPQAPFDSIPFKEETNYRRTGSFSTPASPERLERKARLEEELSTSLEVPVIFDFGDMFADADVESLAGAYDHLHGGTGLKAGPHVEFFVRHYGVFPKSFIGGGWGASYTDATTGFYGGGVRSSRHSNVTVLGFTPNLRAAQRVEVGPWLTERLGALTAQIADLENRVGQDRMRFPGLPAEHGALLESTMLHEMGHLVKSWYEANHYDLYLRRRTDILLKDLGGSRGVEVLVSDYAATGNELLSEVMARALHQNTGKGSNIAPVIDEYLKDVMNGMRAIEARSDTSGVAPGRDTKAIIDAEHGPIMDALFGNVRESSKPEWLIRELKS